MRRAAQHLNNRLAALGHGARIVAGIGVLATVAFMAWLISQSVSKVPFSDPWEVRAVLPADAPLLIGGDEVRIAGKRIGTVKEVEPGRHGRLVTFALSDEAPLRRGTRATVHFRGFAGSTYVDLDPGGGPPLPEGATIPRADTRTVEQLADIAASFGAADVERVERNQIAYGGGLIGRGEDLNAMLADLAPFARDGARVLRAMAPGRGELSGVMHELRRTARGFAAPGRRDLPELISGARGTFEVTAMERESLGRFIDELRPLEERALTTLPVADPVLADTSAMARRLAPALVDLNATLPTLNALLDRGRGLRRLSRFARAADPVVAQARPLLGELWPSAASLRPLSQGLEPFMTDVNPYGDELVHTMVRFNGWSQFRYAEGKASGANAARFTPVFTCHHGHDAFTEPGEASRQRSASLLEACR